MSDWTHAGEQLPWLRGQHLHVASAGSESLVAAALTEAGYAVAQADTGAATCRQDAYRAIAAALYLPGSAGTNLDALADALAEIADRWPSTDRVALLWAGADALVTADLLGFTELCRTLVAAAAEVWSPRRGRPVVFETIAFVADGYGADKP